MNIVGLLYRLARAANDLRAWYYLFTGRPGRFFKRQANKWIGRNLGRRLYWK